MSVDLLIKSAYLPNKDGLTDMAVEDGCILALEPAIDCPAAQVLDLHGRLVSPGFVEPHLHLDIALMNAWEQPGRPAPFQSPAELNAAMEQRRKFFTPQDITARALSALKLASQHGITAVRAQCQVDPEVGLKHLLALLEAKEQAGSLVDVQIVAFPQQGLGDAHAYPLFCEAFRLGADVMGCAPNLDRTLDFRTHIDTALTWAGELDVDLDAHADLSIPTAVKLEELESVYLARRAIEMGYQGRVTAGHICTLDSALPAVQAQAIETFQQAKMNVVSQPDLYRLGRQDEHHVRRGLTRLKALLAAGVNVCFASNNVRDAFRPLGNLNPLEEALVLAYGAHMDSTAELETLFQMATTNPARALKLKDYGLEPGCWADFVVLGAPSPAAAIADQAPAEYVFKHGRLLWRTQVVCERCEA